MKTKKQSTVKNKVKAVKVFKSLDNKQLELVIGGPVTSRGTETTVQQGT
jgi:bacteriocin-like protein